MSRTRPARPSVCTCRVIACRVTPVPSLKCVIESGPSVDKRPSRVSRVWSPRAAKTGTASLAFNAAMPRLRDMSRNVVDLAGPPTVVHAERLSSPSRRDPIKTGLYNGELGTALFLLENELDERSRLGRIVRRGVDRVWVPPIREIPLGLDALDHHLHRDVLVPGMSDPPADRLAFGKRALQAHSEPRSKLFRGRDRAPHACTRGAKHDLLFDAVSARPVWGLLGGHGHGLVPPCRSRRESIMQHMCCIF